MRPERPGAPPGGGGTSLHCNARLPSTLKFVGALSGSLDGGGGAVVVVVVVTGRWVVGG